MFNSFLFDNWKELFWIFLMAVLIYLTLIVILRSFGKRALTNVNMFDFIITIAYGSAFAGILLSRELSFLDGALILFMLTAVQVVLSKLQMHSRFLTDLVKAKPVFLYYEGRFCEEAIRRERFQPEDLTSAIRKRGLASFEQVEAMILEGDGTLAVVKKGDHPKEALDDVVWLEPKQP